MCIMSADVAFPRPGILPISNTEILCRSYEESGGGKNLQIEFSVNDATVSDISSLKFKNGYPNIGTMRNRLWYFVHAVR